MLDETIDDVREAAEGLLNSEGRSLRHVALGVALTAGFALLATAVATRAIPPRPRSTRSLARGDGALVERPRGAMSLILPAVFSATTLSALRVWNAPGAPGRNGALRLWGLAQAVNAVWLALRPRSRAGQVAAAMTSAGLAAAFAHEARKFDLAAGRIAAPTGAGVHVANALQRRLKPAADATAH